jgi:predicted Rossmann fold nucleotide-binding protein DprA/Smf involved in DNA uptake
MRGVIAGTGHRPDRLGIDYSEASNRLLRDFARDELAKLEGITGVISGMATGWDQALAEAAVPVLGMESRWPPDGRARFHEILTRAARIEYVPGGEPANWKFLARDRWMVDNADGLLALYDGGDAKSGTGYTVTYAEGQGKPVINVWEAWACLGRS